ncbi:histidinol-phosphate transaminase [Aliiglaciecola litoralis]|uniref:Histidinol-phosphate transaminase n=1 Tax=Aliiglaciecola litoralis TaxID=582857 RepID=A0ABN1LCH5_9ALTE
MVSYSSTQARRSFLKHLGAGAALISALPLSAMATTGNATILPFRQGAKSLSLHFNENSLGMSPKALSAAQRAVALLGNRYPDDAYDNFKLKLAKHHQIAPDQLLFGNGSTEVIQAVVTHMAQQNAVVIEPTPTFGALRFYAQAENLKVIQIPLVKHFEMDITALKKAASAVKGPVLINLCNPNNPTGNIVHHQVLTEWITSAPEHHVFLLDEAYYDYAKNHPHYRSGLELIKKDMDNVVISRTFSKVHGMAGMRIGYGIATRNMATQINPFAARFNLNIGGLAAADAALDDKTFYQQSLEANAQSKRLLTQTLLELELPYVDSHTNFVLHKINTPLAEYSRRMGRNGIRVGRKMTENDHWNRISLGTPDEMLAFCKTLRAFRQHKWV